MALAKSRNLTWLRSVDDLGSSAYTKSGMVLAALVDNIVEYLFARTVIMDRLSHIPKDSVAIWRSDSSFSRIRFGPFYCQNDV